MSELTDPDNDEGCGVSATCFTTARCHELCGDPSEDKALKERLIPIPNMLTRAACDIKHLPVRYSDGQYFNGITTTDDITAAGAWGWVYMHELTRTCFLHRHEEGEMIDVLRRWLVDVLQSDARKPVPSGHTPGTHRLPKH